MTNEPSELPTESGSNIRTSSAAKASRRSTNERYEPVDHQAEDRGLPHRSTPAPREDLTRHTARPAATPTAVPTHEDGPPRRAPRHRHGRARGCMCHATPPHAWRPNTATPSRVFPGFLETTFQLPPGTPPRVAADRERGGNSSRHVSMWQLNTSGNAATPPRRTVLAPRLGAWRFGGPVTPCMTTAGPDERWGRAARAPQRRKPATARAVADDDAPKV